MERKAGCTLGGAETRPRLTVVRKAQVRHWAWPRKGREARR